MEIVIILILILINGIFSMAEIAMVSARKSRLESAAKRGDKSAKAALETIAAPNRFLSTVQIGITLIGIMTGIFSGENITNDIQHYFEQFSSTKPYAHTLSVTVVVGSLTFFSLVLGELVPKRIGLANPESIAKVMARPMKIISVITSPFVWLLTVTSDMLIKLFRIKPSSDSKVTEEEIKAIIQEGTEGGEVQEIEQDIVERVFHLGDRNISSLMTHRNDLIYLNLSDDSETVRSTVNTEMHSIYPVFETHKDQVKGVVLLKDLFRHINDADFNLESLLISPFFLSEHITAYEALVQFKESKTHYGIITDEFGQTQGIITLNDLLQALVGDFSDFYSEEFNFIEREDGSWLIDGQYPLAEFFRHFDLEDVAADLKFTTIGGLVMHEIRTIPTTGQVIQWMNFEIEVVDMDGARIDKVIVRVLGE
ncbi:MAG TPA: hemolysin family protein [Fluviicola sp.]|nr:hemolysin family protein [Fluviicola sp.]